VNISGANLVVGAGNHENDSTGRTIIIMKSSSACKSVHHANQFLSKNHCSDII
jgi:hypothetical protein